MQRLTRTISLTAAAAIVAALLWAFGGSAYAGGMMAVKTGDTNGDGATNSLDALVVLTYDAGLIEHPQMEDWDALADVNCDMLVNSVDATMILQVDAGLIEIRP